MDNLIRILTDEAIRNNTIAPEQFKQHGIKRALRNEDGTGVKTILTEISDVRGYKIGKGKVPIEGHLVYRGIEIVDLVEGFLTEGRHGFDDTAYLLLFRKWQQTFHPDWPEKGRFQKDLLEGLFFLFRALI